MKKIKEQKGFAASDALIAVLILALFSGLIATISYNIYLSNASVKRMSKATNYIVDVFEHIEKVNYDEISVDTITEYFNRKYYYENDRTTPKANAEVKMIMENENADTPFQAEIGIVKYSQTEGTLDTEGLDLVQEITMTVRYKLGNKNQEITMTRNKTK